MTAHLPSKKVVYLILTSFFIVAGFLVTVCGISKLSTQSGDAGSNINSQSAGIGFGWGPPNPPDVYVSYIGMAFSPRIYNSDISYLWITINANINTSRTFTFAFMSPFLLTKCRDAGNGWSTETIGGNSSIIYLDYTAPANRSKNGSQISDTIGCEFTGLPTAYDHGKYTVIIPFGAGPPPWLWGNVICKAPYFQTVKNQRIDFMLYVPIADTISGSFPQYWADGHGFTPDTNLKSQEVRYFLDETTDLTVQYENSQEISIYSNSQQYGLFFLGLGIPTLFSSSAEFIKTWKRIE